MTDQLFLHRLHSLQSLCSNSDDNLPHALLFIPGQDGRHNRGSMSVLKYLFEGAVGKDIFEGSLDERFESLEEIVYDRLMTPLKFHSQEAKAIIGDTLFLYPYLIEYSLTIQEEENLDLFQLRKCEYFKRMVLRSTSKSQVIGVPVPLGYDDVLDTENWPLFQAFALDDVFCPTGFFTSRYAVVDITDSLNIVFQTVDGYYIENAISTLQRNILPHHEQMLGILCNNSSLMQRECLVAEELVSPLDLLFEFGELETVYPVDPKLRPRLFVGEAVGKVFESSPSVSNWKDEMIGNHVNFIVESCEPSTGLRWCRTYLLHRGKFLEYIVDEEALVLPDERFVQLNPKEIDVDPTFQILVDRLEILYFKLWVSLRWAVRTAFLKTTDILDAGGLIQSYLSDIMTGRILFSSEAFYDSTQNISLLNSIRLENFEKLLVHMDCMNALGQIVNIEDVDDMGGQCWTYIRVSIHDVVIGDHQSTIALGDTFIFSPHFAPKDPPVDCDPGYLEMALFPHIQDAYCVTHIIPQYRLFNGPGFELMRAQNLVAISKSSIIETSGAAAAMILTDHPICPYFFADLRLFSGGFIIDRIDKTPLPLLISIKSHVERIWTVDMEETFKVALQCTEFDGSGLLPIEGILIIFKIRENFPLDQSLNGFERCLQYCQVDRIFPSLFQTNYLAFIIPTSSMLANHFSYVLHCWRDSARLYDIPESRGLGENMIPKTLLLSYLAALNRLSLKSLNAHTEIDNFPGYNYLRNNFLSSENARIESVTRIERKDSLLTNKLVILIGPSGCGVLNLFCQMIERLLADSAIEKSFFYSFIDLGKFNDVDQISKFVFSQSIGNNNNRLGVLGIEVSPLNQISPCEFLSSLEASGNTVISCIGILQPSAFQYPHNIASSKQIGYEAWISCCRGIAHLGKSYSNNILIILETRASNDHSANNLERLIEVTNSNADIIRIYPHNIWLNGEFINSLLVFHQNSKLPFYHHGRLNVAQDPDDIEIAVLRTIRIKLPNESDVWDLEKIQLTLQELFPEASLSNTFQCPIYSIPHIPDLSGVQLALFLARLKVFSTRRRLLGLKEFNHQRSQIQETLRFVGFRILSVSAVIRVASPKFSTVCVEGSPGSIIIRPKNENIRLVNDDSISIQGCFRKEDVLFFRKIFQVCVRSSLLPRPYIQKLDIKTCDYSFIEKKYNCVPLPSGWWFDGASYVDVHGSRLMNRPDMETLLQLYINEQNVEIDEYNKVLKSVISYV